MSKFEKKAYDNIKLNESVLGSIFKLIFKPTVKKMFKKMKELDDPNFNAETANLEYHIEEFQRGFKEFCKKYPKECK